MVGLIGGSIVLTIGLLIARAQPWWLTVLVGASIFAIFFASTGNPSGLITALVMAVAFVLAARQPSAPGQQPAPVPAVNLAR
ncbi:hypothetical protein GCM10022251_20020 [Phytohabitans flavus]|uniref:Uncharacterized protein n=1 Tax=Phytohabitans flavus TaxID=1076124 RepID=A0A6F8XZM9_9ACTN|nr:hypothetical protein [Phytohabitans flavus]BCB79178.1 hypothetical protein Pflav_055880 [Phytohabitans flavus]